MEDSIPDLENYKQQALNADLPQLAKLIEKIIVMKKERAMQRQSDDLLLDEEVEKTIRTWLMHLSTNNPKAISELKKICKEYQEEVRKLERYYDPDKLLEEIVHPSADKKLRDAMA